MYPLTFPPHQIFGEPILIVIFESKNNVDDGVLLSRCFQPATKSSLLTMHMLKLASYWSVLLVLFSHWPTLRQASPS